ncbi:hypothetical protein [Sinorhizobium meliloti]|uniref:hypothetical protein n=1 Tax=Rhizobium meliloti TaxID=382 RepID=UPI000FDA681C|nr:hypothetical protein [Sinorhizobium meliloti]RVI21004.1 hypothetical protein CN207_32610 [Sinorhizobium meliloti]
MVVTKEEAKEICDQVNLIVDAIKPHLAGHPPEVQSVVLADLVATFIAGWSPNLRKKMLDALIANVGDLIHVNEMILFGPEGHPDREMTRQ